MYGLMLLLAIAACIWLTGVRWSRRGGDWDLVLRVAVWGVAAGIVGARAYHDITSWNEVSSPKWRGSSPSGRAASASGAGSCSAASWARTSSTATGARRARLHGCGRAGAPARAGDRALGQLVEPGALRQADRSAVGPEDRCRPPRRSATRIDSPSSRPSSTSSSTTSSGWAILLLLDRRYRFRPPALFALYVSLLHVRAFLRGAPSDRPGAPFRRAAAERLGLDRRLRDLDGVLRLVAVPPAARGVGAAPAAAAPGARGADDGDPEGPRPALPLGSAAWSCASSSWTSTPSKARSTCS